MKKLDSHIQTFRIDSETKKKAEKIADKDHRKLNDWIRLLIMRVVENDELNFERKKLD